MYGNWHDCIYDRAMKPSTYYCYMMAHVFSSSKSNKQVQVELAYEWSCDCVEVRGITLKPMLHNASHRESHNSGIICLWVFL